jgi:hypothetical protein
MRAVMLLAGCLFVCRAAFGQGSGVQRECISSRETAPRAQAGRARFIMDHDEPRFRVRSATLTRSLTCSFRRGRLLHAEETFYLRLVSHDRDDPGFTTGAPGMSRRYYLVCEGRVGTMLAGFTAAQTLSFADNTFTLPCGHMIYRAGVSDPAGAERVSGAYAYRVQSATWTVRRGPTPARPTFDVAVDAVVLNPIETLHLRGRLVGELTTTVRVFVCPEQRNTRQELPPGC